MPDNVDNDYSERNDDVMNFQVRRLNVTKHLDVDIPYQKKKKKKK